MNSEIDSGFDPVIDQLANQIARKRERLGSDLFETGGLLIEAKSRLGHGKFGRFLNDERVAYKEREAQHLMNIARAEDGLALAALGIAKAVQLLRVNLDCRRELFVRYKLALLSVSRIREIIDALAGGKTGRAAGPRTHRAPNPTAGSLRLETTGGNLPQQVAWAAGVLHLPLEALSPAAVQSAFRELTRLFHPDANIAGIDARHMRSLIEARQILRNYGIASEAA